MYDWEKQYKFFSEEKSDIQFRSLAALIRFKRVSLGITQKQLAHRLGVARSTVAMYESAQRLPNRTHMRLIVSVLKLDMSIYYYLLL